MDALQDIRLVIEARLLCARATIEGMIAENKIREYQGKSLAYDENSFQQAIVGIEENDILSLLYGATQQPLKPL